MMIRMPLPRAYSTLVAVQRRVLSNNSGLLKSAGDTQGESTTIGLICASAFSLLCLTAAAANGMSTTCEEDKLEYWTNMWKEEKTGWHRREPSADLVRHYERFLGTTGTRKSAEYRRILVPLCGKTIDIPYLAERGHEVLGVEGIEAGAWQLQRDAWLKFVVSQVQPTLAAGPGGDEKAPAFIAAPTFDKQRPGYVFKTDSEGTGYYVDNAKPIKWFRDTKKRISLVIHDFFRITPRDIGTFDRIWDRSSLVVVNPADREAYVATCDSLLEPGGRILLVTLVYDQKHMKGPPFSVPVAEVQRLYGKLGYEVEMLSSFDTSNDYQGRKWDKLQKAGLQEVAIILTKPSSSTPGWFARVFLGRKPRQY